MRVFVVLGFALCAGCTVTQDVKPVNLPSGNEICIIKNPEIYKETLLDLYAEALGKKGLVVKVLENDASRNSCPITSVYAARWGWDFGNYMTYLKFRIYQNGELAGEAIFDATDGGGRLVGKGIDDREKVFELVNKLIKP